MPGADEIDASLRRRIEITVACHDSDGLPRVANAGRVERIDGVDVQFMHNGVRVVAGGYYGAWMREIIERLRGVHEPQEELAFDVMVRRLAADTKRPVVVEVGSFWAYYSLWALRECPDARSLMVEPDPNYLEVGRRNFALNSCTGTFLQAAVGERPKAAVSFECESDRMTRRVPVVDLRTLVERFQLPRIDLLLVDVQGAELGFLRGALPLIKSRAIRMLLVSTHHHSISGDPLLHRKVLELLVSSGAHVIAEHTVAESTSGDGLVAVSFDERDADLNAPISYCRAANSLFGDPLVELAGLMRPGGLLRLVAGKAQLRRRAGDLKRRIRPPG